MRDMRKFYIKKFNEETKYMGTKRNKPSSFIINSLNRFVNSNFPEIVNIQRVI